MARVLYISLFSVYIILFITIFYNSIPYNPLAQKNEFVEKIMPLFPEGWAFFTKNPREEVIYFYSVGRDNSLNLVEEGRRNADLKNWFGLKRDVRYLSYERGLVISTIKDQEWYDCKQLDQLLIDSMRSITVEFASKMVFIQPGKYIIQYKEPIPFAWRNSADIIEMPSKVVLVEII